MLISKLVDFPRVQSPRSCDDPDVIEASLLKRLDRFGDRMVPRSVSHETGHYHLEQYEADLKKIDRRLASRASQGRD